MTEVGYNGYKANNPQPDLLECNKINTNNKDSFNLMEITRQNVLTQINNILTYPELKKNIESNSVDLHGWVYDIKHGSIEVYDSEVKSFISFEEFYESPENE